MRDYINIDDSYHYNLMNTSVNNLSNSKSNSGPFYKIRTQDRKNIKALQFKINTKLKLNQNNFKTNLESIDSSDNNIFNSSKNEENIITKSKNKNENINPYDNPSNNYISTTFKNKNLQNISKQIQSTEQIFTKTNPNQKKRLLKLDSSKIDSFYVVINEKMRDITDEEISTHYSVEEVNNDATNLELIKKYSAFLSGKRAKTREVMGFLYQNDQNEYYLYLVG